MRLSAADLSAIAGGRPILSNVQSVIFALDAYGVDLGLNKPHRLAHLIAQLAHESGGFRYDGELWGPTDAQKRYDTRTDLGNTPQKDGDGYKYRGRGPVQTTGRYNYSRFTAWAKRLDPGAPDFVAEPDKLNIDPWEGLSALWYWSAGNPTGKSLNILADRNDIETITRRINGGLNGFDDRQGYYARAALFMLGYPLQREGVIRFQKDAGLEPDGIAGPKTRDALHQRLVALDAKPAPERQPDDPGPLPKPETKPAPQRPAPQQPSAAAFGAIVVLLILAIVAAITFFA